MDKNKKIAKLIKFLLQMLLAALTSWGTAAGYTASTQGSDKEPFYLDDDYPSVYYGCASTTGTCIIPNEAEGSCTDLRV